MTNRKRHRARISKIPSFVHPFSDPLAVTSQVNSWFLVPYVCTHVYTYIQCSYVLYVDEVPSYKYCSVYLTHTIPITWGYLAPRTKKLFIIALSRNKYKDLHVCPNILVHACTDYVHMYMYVCLYIHTLQYAETRDGSPFFWFFSLLVFFFFSFSLFCN